MENESGVPKPSDLFVGVIDLFAVLVPGIIAVAFIATALRVTPQADVFSISAFFIAGWVLGHFLNGIGSCLDTLLYDPLFKPGDVSHSSTTKRKSAKKFTHFRAAIHAYLHKNDELYSLAEKLTIASECLHENARNTVPAGMYQWARAWLNFHSPVATASLDRIEADSKLFRSLAVLLLSSIPVIIAIPDLFEIPRHWKLPAQPQGDFVAIAVIALLFSLWRYCDLRNKMIRRCYLAYVQLRNESPSRLLKNE